MFDSVALNEIRRVLDINYGRRVKSSFDFIRLYRTIGYVICLFPGFHSPP